MKQEEVQKLKHGLYRVFWKDGYGNKPSLCAVGSKHNGDRWICCTNWTSASLAPSESSSQSIWDHVEKMDSVVFLSEKEIFISEVVVKVYCNQCKHYEFQTIEQTSPTSTKPVFRQKCLHSSNVGTWENTDDLRRKPSEINKDNNCLWYQKKGNISTNGIDCPICGAKMFYSEEAERDVVHFRINGIVHVYSTTAAKDGTCHRKCVCENGHEFTERTNLVVTEKD